MALVKVQSKLPSNLLVDRFIVPPFSILNTNQGYWKKRSQEWKRLGIRSELGRGDNQVIDGDDYKKTYGKCNPESIGDKYGRKVQATSIFDPVLCEISYKWFSRKDDRVLDPFAGGSVRGIVASVCGRKYTGIDLSRRQVESNIFNLKEIQKTYSDLQPPQWFVDDSHVWTSENSEERFNMLFTCPPYYDLEVYSNDPADISNLDTYEEFLSIYKSILTNSVGLLENDSFAVIVVGNIRNKNDSGYYDFAGDTIRIMQDAGAIYYNEMIIVNSAGTLPIRTPIQFNSLRKIGKQHQNVLVFYKGNVKNIKEKFGAYEGGKYAGTD